MFPTEDHAKQFAEQHAQVTATGMPLTWNDTQQSDGAHHANGEYRIVRIDED
jgi:hypothetical protein